MPFSCPQKLNFENQSMILCGWIALAKSLSIKGVALIIKNKIVLPLQHHFKKTFRFFEA